MHDLELHALRPRSQADFSVLERSGKYGDLALFVRDNSAGQTRLALTLYIPAIDSILSHKCVPSTASIRKVTDSAQNCFNRRMY